jgi:hypothetical protein
MQVATDTQGYQNYRRVGPERWLDDRSDNGGVVAFRSEVEALIHQLLPSLLLLTSPPPLRHRVVLVLVVLVIIGLSRVLQRCCQGLCGNTCACQAERLV